MANKKLPVLILRSGRSQSVIAKFLRFFRELEDFDPHITSDFNDAVNFLREHDEGLFIFEILDEKNVRDATNILEELRPKINQGFFRVMGFDLSNQIKLQVALEKLGCKEFVDPRLTEKSLLFKLSKHHSIIKGVLKRSSKSLTDWKQNKDPSANEHSVTLTSLKWKPAIDHPSDCWILERETKVRPILGQWLIELIGPPPNRGKWVKIEIGNPYGLESWKWKPHVPKQDPFVQAGTSWVFFGRMPEFDANSLNWRFVSKYPALELFKGKKRVETRFKFGAAGKFVFSENSHIAYNKLARIKEELEILYHHKVDRRKVTSGMAYIDRHSKPLSGTDPSISRDPTSPGFDIKEARQDRRSFWNQIYNFENDKQLESMTDEPKIRLHARFTFEESDPVLLLVNFVDLTERNITIEIPDVRENKLETHPIHRLKSNQPVSIKYDIEYQNLSSKDEIQGLISHLDSIETSGASIITIDIARDDQFKLDLLFEIRNRRQKNVNEFLRLAQGK